MTVEASIFEKSGERKKLRQPFDALLHAAEKHDYIDHDNGVGEYQRRDVRAYIPIHTLGKHSVGIGDVAALLKRGADFIEITRYRLP